MNLCVFISVGIFFTIVFVAYLRQSGGLAILDKPLKFFDKPIRIGWFGDSAGEIDRKPKSYTPRKYENPTLLIFGVSIAGIASRVSKYIFLCFLYGALRVRNQGLQFADMSHGHAWIVSNGDQIGRDIQPLLFVIFVIIWVVPTLIGFVLIRRLLPMQAAVADRCAGAKENEHLIRGAVERHSLVKKMLPLRIRALRFLFYWVLSMVFCFCFARWLGRLVLVFIPAISMVLYIVCNRLNKHQFAQIIIGISCPKCGEAPLRFEPPTVENGMTHLLICERCHIEWDLGSV